MRHLLKLHTWKRSDRLVQYNIFPEPNIPNNVFRRRRFSTPTFNSSTKVLKLTHLDFTQKELRDAYFTAAKLCHPDLNKTKSSEELSEKFLEITEAYEYLQKKQPSSPRTKSSNGQNNDEGDIDWSNYVTKSEEQVYRDACQEILGLDAEIVEESKRCSLFRDWLKGKTDAAFHWNNFFMLHGGLAPMLRRKKLVSIGSGEYEGRRRKRNTRRRSIHTHSLTSST